MESFGGSMAEQYGVMVNQETMENGELRFRMLGADGSSYIRCENPGPPVWENSHFHATLRELVLVQSGQVVFAEYRDGKAVFYRLEAGDIALTAPGVPHNECVGPGAVVHTIKYGDCTCRDWVPSDELDRLTKQLAFEEALGLAGKAAFPGTGPEKG